MKLIKDRRIWLLMLPNLIFLEMPIFGQIVPDRTVGTTVTPNVKIKGVPSEIIDGGTVRGANLFHSFSEFNIQNGRSIYFTNPDGITNIFSRITGSNLSNINGILGVLGNANLFLLNPNGIIFGANAKLDLNGSFIGTTANSIRFADGVEFSATNPATLPILTVSVPTGLQMGQNPGAITVQGLGNKLTDSTGFGQANASNSPPGLQAGTDRTLALIGGGVNFSGGVISTKSSGHLEIGSVSAGKVGLNATPTGWVGDYSAVSQFNDIHLAQESLLNASSSNGSIQIEGQNISLSEGSFVLLQNLGTQSSGGITIDARGSLSLTGNTADGQLPSSIQSNNFGTGQVGDVVISADRLSLQDGARIITRSRSQTAGANAIANVGETIDIRGFNPTKPVIYSGLVTFSVASGKAGNITISTHNLHILDSGQVLSLALNSGDSGTIQVNAADLVEVAGYNPIAFSESALSSNTQGSGNANRVVINTSRLVIQEGASLGSTSLASGSVGSVEVNASESINIAGRVTQGRAIGLPARIFSNAEIVDLTTQAAFGIPPIPTGNAGSLTIHTPLLRLTDGGTVTVKNDGPGLAGNVQIDANSIFLNDEGSITATTASGNGGNIRLNLQENLLLRQHSLLSATAQANGNGGNLSINSPILVGLENSDIIANAVRGNGGNIQITTSGIFGLVNRPQLTESSDISASSLLGLSGTINISILNVKQHGVLPPLPSNFVNTDRIVANSCLARQRNTLATFVVAGNRGLAETPSTLLLPYEVVELRPIETGPAAITSPQSQDAATVATFTWKLGDPIIEATELSVNANRQMVLIAKGNSAAAVAQPHPLPCHPNEL
ncbi:filamentous hemagglutinin N-terminal domain-containing protein [Aerosakkonema funiforme]|uniref:two-partner secretion domain-containing protein n=1 Tax=Aerosakkonema funiforme TaxID=1246630 RepID=UPI0035BA5FC8